MFSGLWERILLIFNFTCFDAIQLAKFKVAQTLFQHVSWSGLGMLVMDVDLLQTTSVWQIICQVRISVDISTMQISTKRMVDLSALWISVDTSTFFSTSFVHNFELLPGPPEFKIASQYSIWEPNYLIMNLFRVCRPSQCWYRQCNQNNAFKLRVCGKIMCEQLVQTVNRTASR